MRYCLIIEERITSKRVDNGGWEKIRGPRVRVGEGVISAIGSGRGDAETPQQ